MHRRSCPFLFALAVVLVAPSTRAQAPKGGSQPVPADQLRIPSGGPPPGHPNTAMPPGHPPAGGAPGSPHGAPPGPGGSPHGAPPGPGASPHGAPQGPVGAPPGAVLPGQGQPDLPEMEGSPMNPHGMGTREENIPWQPAPEVKAEDVKKAAESALDERWTSPDGRFSLRPPMGWDFQQPRASVDGGELPPGELGRFVAPDPILGGSMRVGYVAGPIAGQADEMKKVVKNVRPRWQLMGMEVLPTTPVEVTLGGRPAVISELQLKPLEKLPEGALPPPTMVYAYINNGTQPGIMVQTLVNSQHLAHLRPMLRASFESLVIQLSADEEAEAAAVQDGKKGPPPWLWAPVGLALGLLVFMGLRRRSR
ncbi:MAG: hypothetical protein AB2A00_35385 [Myxococcota bacterium]